MSIHHNIRHGLCISQKLIESEVSHFLGTFLSMDNEKPGQLSTFGWRYFLINMHS